MKRLHASSPEINLRQKLKAKVYSVTDLYEVFTTAVHLCGKVITTQPPAIEAQQAALWSSSYQGTTVVGRQIGLNP